jgi:hypothetical protein
LWLERFGNSVWERKIRWLSWTRKLNAMISQLVEKFSVNNPSAVEQSPLIPSFEDSLLKFEKQSQQSTELVLKTEISNAQIGMIGFDLLEAKQLENAFRSSYNQLTGHWQLSPSSRHRYAFVNCSSRLGREYLFGVLGAKREQLPNLILVVSEVSSLKEFGVTGEERCLVATTPLQSSAVEFCLNALAERRKARHSSSTAAPNATPATPTLPSKSVLSLVPDVPKLVSNNLGLVPRTETNVSIAPLNVANALPTIAGTDQPTFGLTTFPPVVILSLHRSHVRLSALMLHKARTIQELAADTKTTEVVVRNFFEKCREMKILLVHPVKNVTDSQTTLQEPPASTVKSIGTGMTNSAEGSTPSMLGRLRAKFGF